MTRAVKNSPIAKAERRAMVIESSMVILRSTMFSNASLKIGYPPMRAAAMPITLTCGNGSQSRNHTATAAKNTKAMRTSSTHSPLCPCSSRSEPGHGSFSLGDFRVSLRCGGLTGGFSMIGEELIATFPPRDETDIPGKTRPFRLLHGYAQTVPSRNGGRYKGNRAMNRYHSEIREMTTG